VPRSLSRSPLAHRPDPVSLTPSPSGAPLNIPDRPFSLSSFSVETRPHKHRRPYSGK
jgi:hypothetical protein